MAERSFMLESGLIMKDQVLILASNSPRRRQLIQLLGLPFEVHPAVLDENCLEGEDAQSYVIRLALEKGRQVASEMAGLVISADTIVVHRDAILGKPADPQEAREILLALRGHSHQVYSAIALIDRANDIELIDICKTEVPMRNYREQEVEAYIASGDPMDKAGAYGIQHAGFQPVENLKGCFASVMGFPVCHVLHNLRHLGIQVEIDVPAACQEASQYVCPVFEAILENG